MGDAAAYNIVREHFALLAAIVRDHDGAVVKTIGDAVMASFSDPAQAVRAALAMQDADQLESGQGVRDLVLKVGVHAGPSVVVTLNDRLDYFGSTVNMAARLQGQSTGGDIVLSTLRRRRSRGAGQCSRPRAAAPRDGRAQGFYRARRFRPPAGCQGSSNAAGPRVIS